MQHEAAGAAVREGVCKGPLTQSLRQDRFMHPSFPTRNVPIRACNISVLFYITFVLHPSFSLCPTKPYNCLP